MSKIAIALVGVLIVGGSAYAYLGAQKSTKAMDDTMKKGEVAMEKPAVDSGTMQKGEAAGDLMDGKESAMAEKAGESMATAEKPSTGSGSYEAYAAEKVMHAKSGDVVLFFHAAWCPSCRALNTSIENNMKTIPSQVRILKVDYDKETELKKKYGVTYQHTLVQVDAEGGIIKKWSGSGSLSDLLAQIQ